MFGINTYSRVKQCLVLQHYASSCMAMMKRSSGSVELDPQHRVHHLNCERRSVSSVCHDRRDFHTSSKCAGKNLLRKFVNKTKKKLWYETPPQGPPSSQHSALKPPKKRSQEDNMRTRVLNSILYKAITDLLKRLLNDLNVNVNVVESGQPTTSKKPVLFGVDHDALNKQILDYKLRVKDTTSNTLAPELTMQQLEVLAEYRKQKIMEKKKKSKRPVDDDITPKEYLLSRHSQGQEREEEDGRAFSQEDDQVRELMAEESRKS
ncbi:uncharacterized protein LOC135519873 [Oncorhynchus masou masou]|uniref:uncharacterized protein LOC135519873 n=1 Tax=Oncorhynchus masou masou TaxID=90313 RepID=UPI0031831E80